MSVNATLILDALPDTLATLYPDIPTKVFKGQPGPDPSNQLAGFRPGIATTAFLVSCEGPEEVDEIASFEEIFVRYSVCIAYIKPSQGSPGVWEEDPDIREKRQTIRDALYRATYPAAVGSTAFDVRWRQGSVYGDTDNAGQLVISKMFAEFLTFEPRGTNA